MIDSSKDIKPFLRWAGGKTWLRKYININKYSNYHEPFLGGGSIFLHLNPINESFLSDINPKLINTYIAIKNDLENVIIELKKLKNTKEDYYKIRNTTFNQINKQAAQFIFLNQTSFNGIYRENLSGIYNVPYGYRTKDFFSESHLYEIKERLTNVILFAGDFELVLNNVKQNDLIFLDPPYTVSHNNNGFIKYNKNLFSLNDQYRLKEVINEIDKKGATYILTNAAHETILNIFNKDSYMIELSRSSLIGGRKAKRGPICEYLFSNIDITQNEI